MLIDGRAEQLRELPPDALVHLRSALVRPPRPGLVPLPGPGLCRILRKPYDSAVRLSVRFGVVCLYRRERDSLEWRFPTIPPDWAHATLVAVRGKVVEDRVRPSLPNDVPLLDAFVDCSEQRSATLPPVSEPHLWTG